MDHLEDSTIMLTLHLNMQKKSSVKHLQICTLSFLISMKMRMISLVAWVEALSAINSSWEI